MRIRPTAGRAGAPVVRAHAVDRLRRGSHPGRGCRPRHRRPRRRGSGQLARRPATSSSAARSIASHRARQAGRCRRAKTTHRRTRQGRGPRASSAAAVRLGGALGRDAHAGPAGRRASRPCTTPAPMPPAPQALAPGPERPAGIYAPRIAGGCVRRSRRRAARPDAVPAAAPDVRIDARRTGAMARLVTSAGRRPIEALRDGHAATRARALLPRPAPWRHCRRAVAGRLLVVLAANPLDDLRHLRDIDAVVFRGEVLTYAHLQMLRRGTLPPPTPSR